MPFLRVLLAAAALLTFDASAWGAPASVETPATASRVLVQECALTCNDPQVEVFKLDAVMCSLSTLKAYVRMGNADQGPCSPVFKDGAVVAFECSCTTVGDVTCELADERLNDGSDALCGRAGITPPHWKLCEASFKLDGPHTWGSLMVTGIDPRFAGMKAIYDRGEAFLGHKGCLMMADDEKFYASARGVCRASIPYARIIKQYQLTKIPCCTSGTAAAEAVNALSEAAPSLAVDASAASMPGSSSASISSDVQDLISPLGSPEPAYALPGETAPEL